ncbi:beta-N-acetylhexosaminidase [Alteromonadaceae bacterium BrNp21-10]|nr:beta-N-acetylhexosaminidase [Alteromonadaceae bacterium BrNp21-10]
MLDVSAYELNAEEMNILDHPLVGGVILFTRNFHDKGQLAHLISQIRQSARNDLLLAVDHEGGRVQRFREGFTALPAMGKIYPNAGQNIDKASEHAQLLGWLMAAEVLAMDIDISFAPVLDVWGVSDVIGDRSFHSSADVVIPLASAFITGMHDAGMKACGKHFPGHGNVKEDSHIALPIDERSEEEIRRIDMRIFSEIHQQGLLDAVMPAHVIYPSVDSLPAGFSAKWIRTILRQEMDFDGVVFSDDLSMQGAVEIGNFVERAKHALSAGCDMVLACNNPKGAIQVLDGLPIDYQASDRLGRLRKTNSLDFKQLSASAKWQQANRLAQSFE